MADYHLLIARAVDGLEHDTAENRRTLYERARTALVTQLRSTVPPLEEAVITRERLALEEAIRKVEMECLRRERTAPKTDAFTLKRPIEHVGRDAETARAKAAQHETATRSEKPLRREEKTQREEAAPREEEERHEELNRTHAKEAAPQRVTTPVVTQLATDGAASEAAPPPTAPPRIAPLPGRTEHDRRVDAALAEFRKADGRAETNAEPVEHAPAPPPSLESAALKQVQTAAAEPFDAKAPQQADVRARQTFGVVTHGAEPYSEASKRPPRALRSYRRLVWTGLAMLVAVGAGAIVYWQGDAIGNATHRLIASLQSPPPPAPAAQSAAPTRQKNTDRVGQSDAAQAAKIGAISSQRAMLTTEPDPANPSGRDFVGTANWRLEQIPAAPGRPAEVAIRLDVDIPDRGFSMTWLIRRNTDPTLPATHTIDIEFKIAPNSPLGTISEIRSMLMKQPGQNDEGAPLWGHAQKSTPTYFLVGLSAIKADAEHNLKLLKTQPAFDVLLVFSKSGRAFLLIEKGPAGEKVFAEAFAAWRQ